MTSELRDLLGVEAAVVPGGIGERFTRDADPAPGAGFTWAGPRAASTR